MFVDAVNRTEMVALLDAMKELHILMDTNVFDFFHFFGNRAGWIITRFIGVLCRLRYAHIKQKSPRKLLAMNANVICIGIRYK